MISHAKRKPRTLAILLALVAAGAGTRAGVASHVSTSRVSVSSDGNQTTGVWGSGLGAMTPDARFLAFSSESSELVPSDTNGVGDGFLRDRLLSRTERVTLGNDAVEANSLSWTESISADGRYVVFVSAASNLVAGDTNPWWAWDVFVRDRETGTTERISVGPNGEEANNWSAFTSISADGRYVAFESYATTFLDPDGNGSRGDIFVRDRLLRTTALVSQSSAGVQGNSQSYYTSISADGRYVAFASYASNLVAGDTNGEVDIFVRDLLEGHTVRASVSSSEQQASVPSYDPSISADGRFVSFWSNAFNFDGPVDANRLPDVYVRDLQEGVTENVSVTSDGLRVTGIGSDSAISADGRFVAFRWSGQSLVSGLVETPAIYVRDRLIRTTSLASASSDGEAANDVSDRTAISSDGRYVAFATPEGLDPSDTNGLWDVYLRDRGIPTCAGGWSEEGRFSTRIHDEHEDQSGDLGSVVHDASCEYLARRGL